MTVYFSHAQLNYNIRIREQSESAVWLTDKALCEWSVGIFILSRSPGEKSLPSTESVTVSLSPPSAFPVCLLALCCFFLQRVYDFALLWLFPSAFLSFCSRSAVSLCIFASSCSSWKRTKNLPGFFYKHTLLCQSLHFPTCMRTCQQLWDRLALIWRVHSHAPFSESLLYWDSALTHFLLPPFHMNMYYLS